MGSKALYEAEAKVFKAFAHPTRLLLLDELSKGERCVQELVAVARANFSTVSKHLAQLKEAGALKDERRGQQVFYSIKLECVGRSVDCAKSIVRRNLEAQLGLMEAELAARPMAAKQCGSKRKGGGR